MTSSGSQRPNQNELVPLLHSNRCRVCDVNFPNIQDVLKHVESVHVTGCFPCKPCQYTFNTRADLKIHVDLLQHSTGNDKQWTGEEALNRLLETNTCRVCDVTFEDINAAQKHVVFAHVKTKLKCDTCPMDSANTLAGLKVHELLYHRVALPSSWELSKVPTQTGFTPDEEKRMKTVRIIIPKLYICAKCNNFPRFNSRVGLNIHQFLFHTSYQCRMCQSECLSLLELREHISEKHFGAPIPPQLQEIEELVYDQYFTEVNDKIAESSSTGCFAIRDNSMKRALDRSGFGLADPHHLQTIEILDSDSD